jgi:hypothetical protein
VSTSTAQALTDLLAAAEAAMEREDAPAAAQAVEAAVRACAEAAATGVQLDREDLARLVTHHARVQERATRVHQALAAKLEGAGRSRRAAAAYRHR